MSYPQWALYIFALVCIWLGGFFYAKKKYEFKVSKDTSFIVPGDVTSIRVRSSGGGGSGSGVSHIDGVRLENGLPVYEEKYDADGLPIIPETKNNIRVSLDPPGFTLPYGVLLSIDERVKNTKAWVRTASGEVVLINKNVDLPASAWTRAPWLDPPGEAK